MQPISILIVAADRERAWDLGEQLDADGHTIRADRRRAPLGCVSGQRRRIGRLADVRRTATPSLPVAVRRQLMRRPRSARRST